MQQGAKSAKTPAKNDAVRETPNKKLDVILLNKGLNLK